MPRAVFRWRDERGWALISVLCVVAMLSLLAAAGESLTATSYAVERRADLQAHADALLSAGVVRAVQAISDPDRFSRWSVDGRPRKFSFEGAALTISVQDQFGCIDLNQADGTVLRQLLVSSGDLSMEDADVLTDHIRDWRAPETGLKFLHAPRDADYAAAELAYRPRHGPFQSVEELKLVLGMTPEIYERIAPALTVYSKSPMIDPNLAPKPALVAYFGGNALQAQSIMAERAAEGAPALPAPAGHAYAITISMDYAGRTFRRAVVIVLTGNAARPYFDLAWN